MHKLIILCVFVSLVLFSGGVFAVDQGTPFGDASVTKVLNKQLTKQVSCQDSDSGVFAFISGKVSVTTRYIDLLPGRSRTIDNVFADKCYGSKVREYYCNSATGTYLYHDFVCAYGCSFDRCNSQVPSTPSSFDLILSSSNRAMLNLPVYQESGEKGFRFYKKLSGDSEYTLIKDITLKEMKINPRARNDHKYYFGAIMDGNLISGQTYNYKAVAYNSAGESIPKLVDLVVP